MYINHNLTASSIFTHNYIVDAEEPTITLLGANPLLLEAGTSYTELGATASDADG